MKIQMDFQDAENSRNFRALRNPTELPRERAIVCFGKLRKPAGFPLSSSMMRGVGFLLNS